METGSVKRAEVAALADSLRRLLSVLDQEEVTASAATRNRLQGAVVALNVVLNKSEQPTRGADR